MNYLLNKMIEIEIEILISKFPGVTPRILSLLRLLQIQKNAPEPETGLKTFKIFAF